MVTECIKNDMWKSPHNLYWFSTIAIYISLLTDTETNDRITKRDWITLFFFYYTLSLAHDYKNINITHKDIQKHYIKYNNPVKRMGWTCA